MQCPGQDSRYWDGEAVFEANCSECGNVLEFFRDDNARKCGKCGHKTLNPRIDFGCASYCPYASQCLGELPPELIAKKQELLKERVAVEVKKYFGNDFKRIGHAGRVARLAGQISEMVLEHDVEQFNPAVVGIAAYLHDIGIREAERKFDSSAPEYQHQEGPPVAREILVGLDANEGLIEEVCDIIAHHHNPGPDESINFKVLYDADLIVNLEEKQKESPSENSHLENIIKSSFLTEEGAAVGRKTLITN
jgi:hypothetical protein